MLLVILTWIRSALGFVHAYWGGIHALRLSQSDSENWQLGSNCEICEEKEGWYDPAGTMTLFVCVLVYENAWKCKTWPLEDPAGTSTSKETSHLSPRHLIFLTHHQLSEDVKKDVLFAQLHLGHDMTPRISLAPGDWTLGLLHPIHTPLHIHLYHLLSNPSPSLTDTSPPPQTPPWHVCSFSISIFS